MERFVEAPADETDDDRGPSCSSCGSLLLDDERARLCDECRPEDEGDSDDSE